MTDQSSSQSRMRQSPIQLRMDGAQVVITPPDFDRFVKTSDWAVAACAARQMQEAVNETMRAKLEALATRVATWCTGHPNVRRALLGHRDEFRFLLVLTTAGAEHDFELDDAATELDLELHDRFKEFPITVMSVPESADTGVSAFIDVEESLELYARSTGSPARG